MAELVIVKDGKAICNSLMVTEKFGKRHTDVLRDINKILHESMYNPHDMDKHLNALAVLKNNNTALFLSTPVLDFCITTFIMRNYKDIQPKEKDISAWFRDNYKTVLGNDYTITNRKNKQEHMPDFWVKHSGAFIPVEIKLAEVSVSNGVNQLLRYMQAYGCDTGILIGRDLICELPDNILFFKHPF